MITLDQLVERIAVLTREVRSSDEPVSPDLWRGFDANLHRFLVGSIGHHASRVPADDPCRDALREAVDRYPSPLRSPLTYPPPETKDFAARQEQPWVGVVGLPRRGVLQLLPEPDDKENVTLPDVTDPRAVARITCALGALADAVDVLEFQQAPDTGEIGLRTAHVLAAAAVVSRHALAHGSLAAGDRPLAVGRHVEATLAALQPMLERAPTRPLRGLPAVVDVELGDASLEGSISAWAYASDLELRARIPSADTLRSLVSQTAHIASTIAAVTKPSPELIEAGQALKATESAWIPGLTTLVKPSAEFITASRGLFLALEEARARAHSLTEPERAAAADHLGQAMQPPAGVWPWPAHTCGHWPTERLYTHRLGASTPSQNA